MPGGFNDTYRRITAEHAGSVADQIAALHGKINEDVSVRAYLDCYLLALVYDPVSPRAWMVLDYDDTFHYWNLPDLCPVIRATLMGLCPCLHLQKLFNMFLCGKRYRRLVNTADTTVQLSAAVINTLHGLLLGLYPFNERRLELAQRAAIAGRLRQAMSTRTHVEMIASHPCLMCLSLIEYVVNVVEDFCPVEWGMIGLVQGGRSQCLAACEAFRENAVVAAVESAEFWGRLEQDAVGVVAALGKYFKGAHFYQHHHRSAAPSASAHLAMAISSRVIQNTASVFGQLKAAYPHITFKQAEALEEIWTTVYVRRLPAHTTMCQMEALDKTTMCAFREKEMHTFPVCLACCLRKVDVLKCLFRYDCVSCELICNECMHSRYVVHVNMLGRVLYVRDRVLILCDRCLRPRYWDQQCECHVAEAASVPRCFMCDNHNVFSSKDVVDVRNIRMVTVSFCYKHTIGCITSESTVYDMKGLEREVRGRQFRFSLH